MTSMISVQRESARNHFPWFRLRPWPKEQMESVRPGKAGMAITLLVLGLHLASLSLAPGALGQQKKNGEEEAPKPIPEHILRLMAGDPLARLEAMQVLRTNPARSREELLDTIQRVPPSPGRWHAIMSLVEFGKMEDIAQLLVLHGKSADPWERRIIEGVAAGLYAPGSGKGDLSTIVQDFSFVQTRAPREIPRANQGKWVLSRWSFHVYHRSSLPLRVIKKVLPLRGVAFGERVELEKALKKRIRRKDWKAHGPLLLAPVEQIESQAVVTGLARVRISNPLDRPVLVRVGLDAWFGGFLKPPEKALVYVEPGGESTVDVPVQPLGIPDGPSIRLDLRLMEVNRGFIPSFSKLYLPLEL